MRYVVVIVGVALFLIWEILYDDWGVTRMVFNEVARVWSRLGF